MTRILAILLVGLVALPAAAVPIVDGTVDAGYGSAIEVQSVQTQFGDNNGDGSGGGELDAGYAVAFDGGRLYVMLTGNQEHNFNKMDIFIDSKAGGENTLSSTPDYDFNPGGGFISSNLGGLTFDAIFEADYHVFTRLGNTAGTSNQFELDIVDRAGGTNTLVDGDGGGTGGSGTIQSGTIAPGAGGNNTTTFITQNVDFALNNTNSAGVGGGTGAPAAGVAEAVTTGIEFSVALADIGNPSIGDTIRIAAIYNNGNHDFASNQVLGGLPAGTSNLGNNGGINFENITGNQYFSITVIPEPTSLLLVLMGLVGLAGCRRR